jgi:hypothetical protein
MCYGIEVNTVADYVSDYQLLKDSASWIEVC